MQKFFKTDIVDLLKTGLDYNAYGRVIPFSFCFEIFFFRGGGGLSYIFALIN